MSKESTFSMLARLKESDEKSKYQVDFYRNNEKNTSSDPSSCPQGVMSKPETEEMENLLKNMLGASPTNKWVKRS